MIKTHTFWLKVAALFQLLTSALHSLSFVMKPEPTSETEKQLLDLMNTYKMDGGLGFSPTFQDLFTSMSASFTLLYLFGALLNWFLLRKQASEDILEGVLNIQVLIFGILFVVCAFFTFLPPIVCTGLVFLSLLLASRTFTKSVIV